MSRKFFSLPLNELKFEKETDDSIRLKMYAISDGVNRNESEFLLESFDTGIPTIYNKPILAYFNEKNQDTEAHNTKLKLDMQTGEYYYDYNYPEAEKPVGVIPESASITVEEYMTKNWIVIDGGIIWTSYNRSLSRLIKRQLKKKVSVEIEVLDSYMEDGVEKIKSFKFLGITILGKTSDGKHMIEEGIENAHMRMINFSESEKFKKYSMAFEYARQHNFKDEMIPIPKDIQDYMNDFIKGMENFNASDEIFNNHSLEVSILANEGVSIEGAKVIVSKLERLMDEGNFVIANIIGGMKMLTYLKQFNQEEFIENDKIGTGDKIKISLTKKSASDDSWSSVNKTKLRNDLLESSNYKDCIDKCYLVIEEGWEESPSESLKYPVCQIKDGTLVYNLNGVKNARARLKQNTDESYYKSATTKLNKIYLKLGLDEDKKHVKFSKEVGTQMKDVFVALFADKNEYKYIGNTEKSVLAFSLKDNKFVVIPFEKGEDEHITMKEEMAKDAEVYAKPVKGEEEPDEDDSDEKEEFGCGKAMAEEFAETQKEMAEKEEMAKTKEEEFAEKEKTFELEKEELTKTFEAEKTEYESKIKVMESEKEEMTREVATFKTEKFAKIVDTYVSQFALTEEEVTEWNGKSATFESFEMFEKDLVFAFKDRFVKPEEHIVTKYTKETKGGKKSAIETLKEKQLY